MAEVAPLGRRIAAEGVGAFFLGAAWLLWRYRFDERKQAQVRRLLRRRELRGGPPGP